MRIARWKQAGSIAEGFVVGSDRGDVVVPFPDGATVADVLAAGLSAARATYAQAVGHSGAPAGATLLSDVVLLAPLVPASIRDFVAFEEHVEGVSASVEGKSHVSDEWYQAPTFYFTNPHTVIATGDELRPPETEKLDVELELAVVIGGVPGPDGALAETANLTPEAAREHVFGYTIMNDWSARDLQGREMKVNLGPSKGKDFGMTLGPWIVTADEVDAHRDAEGFLRLRAELWINEELVGDDLVSNMGWPFEELVAYAARNSRLLPGDVLGSGTVGHGGCLGELWGRGSTRPPLAQGDRVVMHIDAVGEISNTVGAAVPAPPVLAARKRPRDRTV
jgi:2-keto-4-pentenoate hydratase/2-oxohepta-3-ene-1,7-dioic acid hydratase in catechol pathway